MYHPTMGESEYKETPTHTWEMETKGNSIKNRE